MRLASLQDVVFTMKFRPDEGLNQVLDILKEMVNGLNYRIKDNVIYIN